MAETWKSREGWHLFLYPFAGRQVHLGLASLLAWRAAQPEQATFSIAINDYGLELLSAREIAWAERLPALLATPDEPGALLAEVLASLNATELSRRRFREIARIAGLIFQSHPGERQSNRQLQASAGLFFDVFQQVRPGQPAAGAGRERAAEPGAGRRPAGRGAGAHAGAATGRGRRWRGRRRWRSR